MERWKNFCWQEHKQFEDFIMCACVCVCVSFSANDVDPKPCQQLPVQPQHAEPRRYRHRLIHRPHTHMWKLRKMKERKNVFEIQWRPSGVWAGLKSTTLHYWHHYNTKYDFADSHRGNSWMFMRASDCQIASSKFLGKIRSCLGVLEVQ